MPVRSLDSVATRSELVVGGKKLAYFSLPKLGAALGVALDDLALGIGLGLAIGASSGAAMSVASTKGKCDVPEKEGEV